MTIFWKIAHTFYKYGALTPFARFFEFINYILCANAVSAKVEVGQGTKFWHRGIGCTVYYKAKIGKGCRILPNVMIGSKNNDQNLRGTNDYLSYQNRKYAHFYPYPFEIPLCA